MKLSDWAKKQGISYITAWRWFNNGTLPVKAYRSDSGTIIVQDESDTSEQVMGNAQSADVITTFFLKTVEFSKNNRTIEEFAAWVMSTFNLKFNTGSDSPKYSRNKPKPEEIQKHFQQFIKKDEKPKPNIFVTNEETLDEIVKNDGLGNEEKIAATLKIPNEVLTSPDPELNKSFFEALLLNNESYSNNITTYDNSVGGVVLRSVESTPQLNYTGSTNAALDSNFTSTVCSFNPMQSTLSTVVQTTSEVPKLLVKTKRGRKPANSFRK